MAFIFGGNTPWTYEDIQRKRRVADELVAANATAPRNVGEGLAAIGRALAGRAIEKRASARDAELKADFERQFGGLFGGQSPSAAPGVPQPIASGPVAPPDPNNPAQIGADTMAALGKPANLPSKDEISAYITSAAAARGIDPSVALAVANSEGLNANPAEAWQSNFVKNGKREESYGPFQLYLGGGLGNNFVQQTGLDPRNLSTWQKQVDFALDHAKGNGWGSWHGAANTGIGNWDGINGSKGGAQQGFDPSAIMGLIGNPYASPGQKAVLEALLGQQMNAADPAYQLDLALKRAELAQAQAPDPGFTMVSPEQAKAMGLPPGAYQVGPDGKVSQIGGGGTNVTVNNGSDVGTIPQGFELFTDPDTGARSMRPIAGGPEDKSAQAAATAGAKETMTSVITNAATRAREAAASRQLGGVGQSTVAWANPYSDSAEVKRQVDVLKSNATIEALNAMRQQSPTGGALGNVTESEGQMLAAKAGALDPSSPYFERDLADYYKTLLETVHGPQRGAEIFKEQWPENGGDPAMTGDDAAYLKSLGLE